MEVIWTMSASTSGFPLRSRSVFTKKAEALSMTSEAFRRSQAFSLRVSPQPLENVCLQAVTPGSDPPTCGVAVFGSTTATLSEGSGSFPVPLPHILARSQTVHFSMSFASSPKRLPCGRRQVGLSTPSDGRFYSGGNHSTPSLAVKPRLTPPSRFFDFCIFRAFIRLSPLPILAPFPRHGTGRHPQHGTRAPPLAASLGDGPARLSHRRPSGHHVIHQDHQPREPHRQPHRAPNVPATLARGYLDLGGPVPTGQGPDYRQSARPPGAPHEGVRVVDPAANPPPERCRDRHQAGAPGVNLPLDQRPGDRVPQPTSQRHTLAPHRREFQHVDRVAQQALVPPQSDDPRPWDFRGATPGTSERGPLVRDRVQQLHAATAPRTVPVRRVGRPSRGTRPLGQGCERAPQPGILDPRPPPRQALADARLARPILSLVDRALSRRRRRARGPTERGWLGIGRGHATRLPRPG